MDRINISTATFIIIVAQLGGVFWFGADLAARVSTVENRFTAVEFLPPGSGAKLSEMSDRLARIETKLEILMKK
jgi:hypothetical protein|tara:strand:- start:685 stop:906 length:222 start_codon:yes stop_codon:yes gene_type:complete